VSSRLGGIEALALLLDRSKRLDAYTREHQARVTALCAQIVQGIGIREPERSCIVSAARLHDIGKIGLPSDLLIKQSSLSEKERALVELHAERGGHFLMLFPELEEEAVMVRHHHERWDGQGYPDHLQSEQIPLAARLIAVVDAYTVMITDRPYQPAHPQADALAELRRCAGSQFDPRVVETFIGLLQDEQDQTQREVAAVA